MQILVGLLSSEQPNLPVKLRAEAQSEQCRPASGAQSTHCNSSLGVVQVTDAQLCGAGSRAFRQ